MSRHLSTRTRWIVLGALSVFAAIAPQAGANTALPVWGCRASAAYVEMPAVLGETRAEPVLANGFPKRGTAADNEQCANASAGLTDVNLLPAGGGVPGAAPLIALQGAYARTQLTPPLGAARNQDVRSDGGVSGPLTITVAGVKIQLDAATASATASCNATTTASFTGTSTLLNLRINDLTIPILANGEPAVPVALAPLVTVAVNQQIRSGTVGVDRSLTQQALRVTVLGQPDALATVVVAEAKVAQKGDTCAAPPPAVTCPAGTIAQDPNATPLVCVLTQAPPCPAGSTPNGAGACVITLQPACGAGTTPSGATCIAAAVTCPAGTVKDPASAACVLVLQRPCPAGSTPDPATRVCVQRVAGGTTVASSGENGRIGSSDGPRATCGRVSMRFVRGFRSLGTSYTSRYGIRTVTRGRLVTCGSNPRPIVGARIDVVHVLPGDKRRRKTGMRSRANGLLTLILPLNLRSRKIEYAYRPNLNTTRVTSRRVLTLTVKNRAGRILR